MEDMLGMGFSCGLDCGAKDGLTASNAYVALHAGPNLRVDEVPCNIW